MKFLLYVFEYFRAIIIMFIGFIILGLLERLLYKKLQLDLSNISGSLLMIANFLVVFILYRNYFQFKGWLASSPSTKKLSKTTTYILLSIVLINFVLSFFLSSRI
ncbi:hypothetical protein MALU111345_22045 [Marinicrinis lubricantis]